ncbi:hypothetical protein ALTERO38_20267 [Alteromonas sp. 38]|nr:hypothetical protein ALTERO38_20267 [Alteromonas sp. 38]
MMLSYQSVTQAITFWNGTRIFHCLLVKKTLPKMEAHRQKYKNNS